jgi:hypothetical protein
MVADANFARAGLTHGNLHQLELFRATVLVNSDCAGLGLRHSGFQKFEPCQYAGSRRCY